MGSYATEVVLILALVLVNGFFAAAEMALITARRSVLKADAEEGSQSARRALVLVEDPSRYLAALQLGITLAGFLASATAAISLAALLAGWLEGLGGWVVGIATGLSVLLVTLAITYVTLVLGELVPKRIGLSRPESVARGVSRPVSWLITVTAPLTWILAKSTEGVTALLGVGHGPGRRAVTEEEIRLLVSEQASLLDEEKQMIQEVFELGDTVAREVMVPRVDAEMLEDSADIVAALVVFRRSGFSRLPVFNEEPDKVVGILLLKDVLVSVVQGEGTRPVTELMRTPTFVPETKPVLTLLKEMQVTRVHMVVVVDEYGGTAGLVTIEDIVEEVIGEISDEFDREIRYVTVVGEGDWILDGRISVEDASDALGLEIPDSEEYETLAGWVLKELGHIPAPGESVELGPAEITVHTVRRRRIARLRARIPAAARTEEGEAGEE